MLLNSVPLNLRRSKTKTDLTPLKDRLVMPEDKEETTTPITQKLKTPKPLSEAIQTPILQTTPITNNTIATDAPPKVAKPSKAPKFKDASISGKHRSSKRQDFAEFYGMGETGQVSSKGTKERVRHRHREKSGEVNCLQNESKPEYSDNVKFDHYASLRSKYVPESAYRY
jgi:hypothetical protein